MFVSNGKKKPSIVVTSSEGGDPVTYTAKHILIATGGYPMFPDIDGIKEHTISSNGFFELEELPKKVIILGSGYIAVEIAGILNALGTDTSLVIRQSQVLRGFDDILSDTLGEEMTKQGITLYKETNGVDYIQVDKDSGLKTLKLSNGEIISGYDCVVTAIGRAPLVDPLHLADVGIEQKPSGHIVVNEYSETNVKGVFAVGDVVGNVELTPMVCMKYYKRMCILFFEN